MIIDIKLSSEKELFSTIKRGRKDIYAHPFVALDVTAYVSSSFRVAMYHYVFYNLSPSFLTDEQIADTEMYKALLSERMKVEKRLGEILKKRSWHKLKKGFCY